MKFEKLQRIKGNLTTCNFFVCQQGKVVIENDVEKQDPNEERFNGLKKVHTCMLF